MKIYKVVFKTFDYWNGPVKLVTRIVEAYDADHVKQLIQKNDDLILEIKQIEK